MMPVYCPVVCPPPQAEVEESDGFQEPCGLDRDEFDEAFEVFSNKNDQLPTTTSVLHPFLKSLGLREKVLDDVARDAKEVGSHSHGLISKDELHGIITRNGFQLDEPWPSHHDVLKAFRVFDSEGLGFIKVTLLKKFLVQAQLEVDDSVLERLVRENCQIDGDDLINYEDFVRNIGDKYTEASGGHS